MCQSTEKDSSTKTVKSASKHSGTCSFSQPYPSASILPPSLKQLLMRVRYLQSLSAFFTPKQRIIHLAFKNIATITNSPSSSSITSNIDQVDLRLVDRVQWRKGHSFGEHFGVHTSLQSRGVFIYRIARVLGHLNQRAWRLNSIHNRKVADSSPFTGKLMQHVTVDWCWMEKASLMRFGLRRL